MLLDELLLPVDLQEMLGGPDPDLLPHVGMRHRIGLPVELDVMVRMDTGELPLGHFKGPLRQGLQSRLLALQEHGARPFAGGAMNAITVLVERPVTERLVELTQ